MCGVSLEWWVEVTLHWVRLNYLKARRFGGANLWFVEFGVQGGFFLAASYIVRIELVFASAGNDTSEFLPRLSCGVGLAGGWSGAGDRHGVRRMCWSSRVKWVSS